MKVVQLITAVGGFGMVGLGLSMALTNPTQQAYEEYAIKELSNYLKEEVCSQAPGLLGGFLQQHCKTLVDTGRPQIEQIITETTERQNFVIFSVYRTNFSINSSLPSYEFETVGIFQHFYIYMYEEL